METVMMTKDLLLEKVIEISAEDSSLSEKMIAALMEHVKEWNVIEGTNGYQLQRTFEFKSFLDATDFVHKIGQTSQTSKHFPHVTIEDKQVTLTWWSPQVSGLHQNDFIMAGTTDEIFNEWQRKASITNAVDEASDESFPASDPPALTRE
jgi:4a-hydroxytetrahydrobiopterin dehydratase